jgi:hypothetical protein
MHAVRNRIKVRWKSEGKQRFSNPVPAVEVTARKGVSRDVTSLTLREKRVEVWRRSANCFSRAESLSTREQALIISSICLIRPKDNGK